MLPLKQLTKTMSESLIQIARSWFAFAQGQPYTKGLMQKRLTICDTCNEKEQLSEAGQWLISIIKNEGSVYRCSLCKCPLAGLTAGTANSCPLQKWGPGGQESYF